MRMYLQKITIFAGSLIVAAFLSAANDVGAATPANENFQVVDGVAIYLGVVPSEVIQGHPKRHAETSMHRGIPSAGRSDHIVVALFDDASGRRIESAQIFATVGELGLGGERKPLQTMNINNSISFGNYFKRSTVKAYRIRLSIVLPDSNRRIEAKFQRE